MEKTWIEECQEMFPESRSFTEEEAEAYEECLKKIFTRTGRNFFDIGE